MSNILPQQVPFCIVNGEGFFIFVNEFFLNLFNISEQECYTELTIQDFLVTPSLVNIYQPSYNEIIFKTSKQKYFAAFISGKIIPETELFAISIRILHYNVAIKRIVTSFRRYIDNQVAVICLKYSSGHFLPLINLNTDMIDDNPSFIINIGNELAHKINNNVRDIKNFSGLIKPQKLNKYQNYHSMPYVFQLLVLDSQRETEIVTETFLLAFVFPTTLLELFKDDLKVKNTIKEHLSQLHSPTELSIQFLEEVKQKVVLYFDSQSIEPASQIEMMFHNLEVYCRFLIHLPYLDAIQLFTEFCVENFEFDKMDIFYGKNNEFTKQSTFSNLAEERVELYSYKQPFLNKNEQITGYIEIHSRKENFEQIERIKDFVSKKLTNLFKQLFQANLELLSELSEKLLFVNNIQDIFETTKDLVVKIFYSEIKVFAALLYDPETETLNFVSQSGYAPTFNVKSIGLNSKNSIVAKSGREKVILNIPDVLKCSFYLEGDPSLRSELSIPLVYNNQLIGVLNIESQNLDAFKSDYHIPLFKLICNLVTTNYLRISVIKKMGKMDLE